jgi:hypothetical protein
MNSGDISYPSTANVTTGNYQPLGTYKSQNIFPFETNADNALRFHVTPSCQDINFITSDSNITINLIKLKFVINDTTDLDYFINNNTIKGWKIVRQSKITSTNKRVISSGLLLNTANLYSTTSPSWIAASPLFDAIGVFNAFGNSHGNYSTFTLGDVATVNSLFNTSNQQSFVYISPDIIENNYNLISGNAIKIFAQVSSNIIYDIAGLVRCDDGSLPTGANPGSNGKQSGVIMIFNSNNISSEKNGWDPSIRDLYLTDSNQINLIYKNAITLTDNTNYKHYLLDSKLFYFNNSVQIPRRNPASFNVISYYTDEQLAYNYIAANTFFTLALNINVVTYYGNYQTFTYQDVATNYLDSQQPDNYTITDVFNGDKFWTKYAIRNKCCINHVANVTTPQQGDIASVTNGSDGNHYGATLGTEALYYGWFLTEGNYDLKHYITASSTNNNVGTQPFFPASSVLRTSDDTTGILTYAPSLGYATGYNKQYNGTKALQTYTAFPSLVKVTNDFSTTHIWSNTQIEGDVNDYYRVFLVANYYSLSRRTGSITRMFIKNNILYTLTKTGLWRNYYNSLNQQATTIGQVFLGTGSAFSIPSTLLNEGEYLGGLQHYNGIVNTPYGTIWFDSISRTFWVFAGGEGIQEENNLNRNINNYLRKFIPNSVYDYLTNSNNFQDDPFKSNTGVTLTYDFYYNRLIVQFYNTTTPLTLSFSFIIKDWVSFHSHNNNYFIDYNKLLLSINNNNLYEWYTNNSNYLTFNTNSYDFILEFIFNKGFKPVAGKNYEIGQDTTKVTDNYVIKSDLLDNTGITLQQKTFDVLTVNNDNQTNTVDLIVNNADYAYETITTGQQLIKYHNQEFRLKNPLDNSEDPKRFKDKYLRIRFKLNGTNVLNIYKFILYYIKIIFRENER